VAIRLLSRAGRSCNPRQALIETAVPSLPMRSFSGKHGMTEK
jgi:hypothetical protein